MRAFQPVIAVFVSIALMTEFNLISAMRSKVIIHIHYAYFISAYTFLIGACRRRRYSGRYLTLFARGELHTASNLLMARCRYVYMMPHTRGQILLGLSGLGFICISIDLPPMLIMGQAFWITTPVMMLRKILQLFRILYSFILSRYPSCIDFSSQCTQDDLIFYLLVK